MRRVYCSVVMIFCLFGLHWGLVSSAFAASSAADTSYIWAKLRAPVWSTDDLTVEFKANVQKCRETYGPDWALENRCSVSTDMVNAPAQGVVLRGDKVPKGNWVWSSYNTLRFSPSEPWQAGTSFTVDMRKLKLPARVILGNSALEGFTLPLAGLSAKGEVWIDPSASALRAVSFALRFTAPVDKNTEKLFQFSSKDPAMVLGKTEVVWGEDATSCVVKVPLTALPNEDALLTLQMPTVLPLTIMGDKVALLDGSLSQIVTVPSKHSLFRIQKSQFTLERVETLALEYHLSLKTSLNVPAADIVKAIKVVELPRMQNPEATVPYRWTQAPSISQEDLAKARPLKVELVQDPGASGDPVVLRVAASPNSYVYCMLPAGFGPAGYTLKAPWTAVYKAAVPESKVSFLQPGNVLTLTPGADNRLDIFSTGVDEVRWRAARVRSDELNFLQIFTSYYDRFKAHSGVDAASTAVEGRISLPAANKGDFSPRFSSVPLSELMHKGTGFMSVEISGLRDGKVVDTKRRLVLATDLGLVSKLLPDGGRQVFVCSLSSGQPVKDAAVRILGTNGQTVAEARTDATGYAVLPSVRGLTREKEPVALVASSLVKGQKSGEKRAEDLAWMALDDSNRRVDYSRFPTQGQVSSPDNINVYVFGQRGIFRPGDTLRFGMVIRRGDWKALPADMPLEATLTDPAGRVAMRRNFTVAEGLAELSWTSQEYSPTGRYRLDVSTPQSSDIIGSGVVRMEEFQPDTLAIRADLLLSPQSKESAQGETKTPSTTELPKGWLVTPVGETSTDTAIAIGVYLRNFYGLPAAGRKIQAELTVRPAALDFAGFADFTFPDMLPLSKGEESDTSTRLPETVTTDEGEAVLPLPLSAYQNRTMLCRVLVEGFEADGGRAVSTEKSFLMSPLTVMLGYRPTGALGSMAYVPQGTRGGLEFLALGPDLRPADPGQLRLTVVERRYVTVLTTNSQGKYVYEESPVDKEISDTTAKVDAATGLLQWSMPTDKPGEFLLTVRDASNKTMARTTYTVAGNDDVRLAMKEKSSDLQSTQLRLRLDKTDYAAGDKVNIFMAAPYDGVGLITLERDKVAAHTWFKAPAGHSVHSLTIPKDFEGRGYINVTMGRAITSPEIFMEPHSFAVAPLTVNAAGRDMGLRIETPQHVLPGSTLTAKVTARHAGKALVFAVDEGVLQLTNFVTPDPLRYLLLDRALEVKTDQLFDLLMPVHSQLGKRLAAFGGDLQKSNGRFQNPFKRRSEPPLEWWSGVVDVSTQGTEVNIPIPAYTNGQVRIMAVAMSPQTVGSAEANTVPRAPLVITPQLPVMAAPGDSFEGGISLHNTTDAAVNVTLKVEKVGLNFEQLEKDGKVTTGLPETVNIAARKELFLPLRCAAADMPGEASLTVVAGLAQGASGGAGQEFRRTATLSVRPPSLPRQEMQTGFSPLLEGKKLPTETLARSLYSFNADVSASVSTAPLPPLRVLLRSLAAYPYRCVEQSVSRALPLVLLQRRPGMAALLTPPLIDGKPRAEVHTQVIDQALSAIRSAFRQDLGMAPWYDAHGADLLLTVYAGDYLLLLREAGFALPGDLSTMYFKTLQDRISTNANSLDMARVQAYGLWVLTRSGVITSQWLDNLRTRLNANWPGWEKDVTGTLMAGSYALMNMHGPAQQLLQAGGEGELLQSRDAWYFTLLAARSLHVAVLARHFPERLADGANTLASRLQEGVTSSSGSTLEAAMGARALLELVAPVPVGGAAKGRVQGIIKAASDPFAGAELQCTAYQPGFEPAAEGSAPPEKPLMGMPPLLSLSAPGCTQFSLTTTQGKVPLYWELATDGYDRQLPTKPVTNGMEVTRVIKLPDGTVLGPDATVAQGTVLRVELAARAFGRGGDGGTGSGQALSVVLADLFPGGFELVLTHPDDSKPENPSNYESDDSNESGDSDDSGGSYQVRNSTVYTRLDRREDRVVAYTSVGTGMETFVYHLRAVNRGRYVLPAAYGEGLYDRSVNSHTAAGVIRVQ